MTNASMAKPDVLDRFLIVLFLVGIYLGIALNLPGGTPVPAALAGVAGLAMLAKRSADIRQIEAFAVIAIVVLGLTSILAAPDTRLLQERFKGLIQFSYSVVITYGFYLTARRSSAAWLGLLCLAFSLTILVLAVFETALPMVRAVGDAFRAWAFDFGIYAADVRDLALYGRVRPKVFTSEPSFVTFAFTLFSFTWYVLSPARLKLPIYLGLLGAGYLVLRGPTVLLGAPLIAVYQILLAARKGGPDDRHIDWAHVVLGLTLAGIVLSAALVAGSVLLEERLQDITSGRDPSFFSRIIAPPLVAARVIAEHPVAGAGLTGWEYIDATVSQIYASSRWLGLSYSFDSAAHAVTNFFWLHWIFLGLGFGITMLILLTVYLRVLGVPSVLFCWAVWTIFGQAAGGYVDPRTWTVLILAAVIATIHEREATPQRFSAARLTMPFAHHPSVTLR